MCVFTIGTYGVNSIILGWAATVCSQSLEKSVLSIFVHSPFSNTDCLQESRRHRHDDFNLECFVHLHSVPFSRGRQAKVCRFPLVLGVLLTQKVYHRNGSNGWLFAPLSVMRLGNEVYPGRSE
jgi:hypothetical protein